MDVTSNPFPGLRPFRTEERDRFFGREGQSEDILRRLRESRIVVLVGASGSGKSSLINAGLLPYVYGGFLDDAGSHWRVAICRPGDNPIGRLAAQLCDERSLRPANADGSVSADDIALMEVTLRGSSIGLIDAVRMARLPDRERMIIVIDQFEELFRFERLSKSPAQDEDAASFVKLLLEVSRQRDVPAYIVLGLRSDYIGDCARFRGLPEAVMSALYLIPRMTRDQQREAIAGPVRVGGGTIAPRLVNRLLNDVGDNPDQLPILQHALMRTWEHWRANHAARPIDLDDYEAIGGMQRALSIHADEAYNALNDEPSKQIARLAFQSLSGKDVNSREARHPATIKTVAAVANTDSQTAIDVINHFRRPDRAFLTPAWDNKIDENAVIDISHESLIRGWDRLKKWTEQEADDAKLYRQLANDAEQHAIGKRGLWKDPELQLALDWRKRRNPNAAWAQRYDPTFQRTMDFLDDSRRARNRLRGIVGATVAGAFMLISAVGTVFWLQRSRALSLNGELRKTQTAAVIDYFVEPWLHALDIGGALSLALAILPDDVGDQQSSRSFADRLRLRNIIGMGDGAGARPPYLPRAELELEKALHRLREQLVMQSKAPVQHAEFSFDGERIVTASRDGAAFLWKADTGNRVLALQADDPNQQQPMHNASFSRDGNWIVTADDVAARLWDANTGHERKPAMVSGSVVNDAAISPDGKSVVTASADDKVRLWVFETGMPKPISLFDNPTGEVFSVRFSPDGKRLVIGDTTGNANILDGESLTPIEGSPLRHDDTIRSVAFSKDGTLILTASWDMTAAVWNADSRDQICSAKAGIQLEGAAFNPTASEFVTASADNVAQVWDAKTCQPIGEPLKSNSDQASETRMRSAVFSPDGNRVLTASDDGTARTWYAAHLTSAGPALSNEKMTAVHSASFSPDGKRIVTGSDDSTVRIWDSMTGELIKPLDGHKKPVLSAVFSPDPGGKFVLTASEDGTALIWDVDTAKTLQIFRAQNYSGPVNQAAFSPDGTRVVTAHENGDALVWNAGDGKFLSRLAYDASNSVRSAAFSKDGPRIVTAHQDGTARIWDATTYKLIGQITASQSRLRDAMFSPNRQFLVTASGDGIVQIWDVRTGKPVGRRIDDHKGTVFSVVFSPDGRRILTASQDKTARLWDAATGESIDEPFVSSGVLWGAAFSPEGSRIIIASANKTAEIFNLFAADTNSLIKYARQAAPRCLTLDERAKIRSFLPVLSQSPEPWCIEMHKYSYQGPQWIEWLAATRAGQRPPLPPDQF